MGLSHKGKVHRTTAGSPLLLGSEQGRAAPERGTPQAPVVAKHASRWLVKEASGELRVGVEHGAKLRHTRGRDAGRGKQRLL